MPADGWAATVVVMTRHRAFAAAATALLIALTGCASAPGPAPAPTPAQVTPESYVPLDRSLEPEQAAEETPEPKPSPSVTIIKTKGELRCRRAVGAEIWMAAASKDDPAWVVDLGQGWRILASARMSYGAPMAFSSITNGDRLNPTHDPSDEPGDRLSMRVLPVEFERGFEAVELAESCALKELRGS